MNLELMAQKVAQFTGRPSAFYYAMGCIVMWMGFGPHENYSHTWQVVINTSTNIITFLVVFLIQASQIHDTKEIMQRLDALVAASEKLSTANAVREATEKVLAELHAQVPSHQVPPV